MLQTHADTAIENTSEGDGFPAAEAANAVFDLLPLERMKALAEPLHEAYQSTDAPFPHVVVDDFFEPAALRRIAAEFPARGDLQHWDSENEDKFTSRGERGLSPFSRTFLYHLNSSHFITFIERVTGLNGLVGDPSPGVHEVRRGGFLKVHVDRNEEPATGLQRRINLFIYLNEGWPAEFGGDLELWDATAEHCVTRIAPRFNRMVVFPVTDTAYHGHPKPLACPHYLSRRTLHVSYHTVRKTDSEQSQAHASFVRTDADSSLVAAKQVLKQWVPPVIVNLLRRG